MYLGVCHDHYILMHVEAREFVLGINLAKCFEQWVGWFVLLFSGVSLLIV